MIRSDSDTQTAVKKISQRTIVRVMEVLEQHSPTTPVNFYRLLYEHHFYDWFVTHAESQYQFNWQAILIDLRNTHFFYTTYTYSPGNITGEYLNQQDAAIFGEILIQHLAALAATWPEGEALLRSLELDGFQVNKEKLCLVPLESPVSEQEEEDRVTALIRQSGLPNAGILITHLNDARSLYVEGKNHPYFKRCEEFLAGPDRRHQLRNGPPRGTCYRFPWRNKQ